MAFAGSDKADKPTSVKPAATGGFDINALDKTADPCTDFYQFACGGWRAKNPLPGDKSRYGRFDELQERNRTELHNILDKVSDPKAKRNPIETKVGDYYAACMDEAAAEKKGATPLEPWLKTISDIKTREDLFKTIGKFNSQGLPGLFGFFAQPDMKDSKQTIAMVAQGGLSLPDRDDYLKADAKSVEKRAKYVEHVQKMFELLGDSNAAAEAKTVLELETELAKASMDRISLRDPKNRDNKMSVADLAALAPNYDFRDYFANTGAPEFTELNNITPKFFKETNGLLESRPIDDWKTLLRWKSLNGSADSLSKAFVDEDFAFNRGYLRGVKEQEPRWKRCVGATDQALGEALGQIYVEKTFGADGKARMQKMIDALTVSLHDDIQSIGWMTDETKVKALEKLKSVNKTKIGYPDKWRDYSTVIVKRDDYVGNQLSAAKFNAKRNYNKIGKPTDRTEWGMTPPTVNAYYNPSNNEIVFPAGILQPPFFDRAIDDAVNFGAIGVVIGHEYTHGFDDQGAKFDAEGNFHNWWSDADLQAFNKGTSCIADEYSGFTSVKDEKNGDIHLKGRLTLGENTADNGGLHISYNALEKVLGEDPSKRKDIDGFTPEQRFFLGFAQVWCENTSEAELRRLADIDPHSPGKYRVIGAVSNSAEFQKAYSCKAGQPMVRDNACRVW
jgi:putative endopeptidase